jgi:hypothetical protein
VDAPPPERAPATLGEALAQNAAREPEQPFLFFRSPRGTFTWWSFAHAAAALAGGARPEAAPAQEFLDALAGAGATELAAARALLAAVATPGEREIWISGRPLERAEERTLALAGVLAGWAIVREAGAAVTPALLLWARPTVHSGDEDELRDLLRALPGEAPRPRRARWLSRRLARLRLLLVERGASTESVARELLALGACAAPPRVLPFPGSGW